MAKNLSEELHDTLNAVIKCECYIKARPFNQRLFSSLCDEMGANHKGLFLHTKVRWLSRGPVLKRVLELCEEIIFFLNQQKNVSLAERFTQKKFVANIAYMSDIFHSLNCRNEYRFIDFHGFTVIDHSAKITAYYKKLSLWQTYIKRDEFDMFPDLKKYLVGKEVNIKSTIIEHLEKLTKKIEQYYGDTVKPTYDHDWTIDPFVAADLPELPLRLEEEFTDMIAERLNRITFNSFKSKHPKVSANLFIWVSMRSTYSIVSAYVIKQLIPFATKWL